MSWPTTPVYSLWVSLYRSSVPIVILSLLSFQSVRSVSTTTTTTIPITTTKIPTTSGVTGCVQNGQFYRPGEEISRGRTGDWCYGSSCSPSGEIVRWDNFNCGTSTTPLTTTSKQNGCLVSGTLYKPGQTISEGKSGNWCYGSYCDLSGTVIAWDNFNCDPTTTPPPTTQPPTTTQTPTTIPPPTTPPSGCEYNGKFYPPGQSIQSDGNGCGAFCTSEGQLVLATCTQPPTTIPPPTTPPSGCEYNGKFYPPGQSIQSDGNGCGAFCTSEGQLVLATCTQPPTTIPPPTTLPSGCEYNGKFYPPGQTIESDANGCGVFCTSDGELVYATCTRAPTTTPITTTPPTTPPKRLGCEYQDKFYPVGARFGEGKDGSWCYGSICGEDGQVLAWDNFNCDPTTRPQTTTPPPTPSPPGCNYNGKFYPPGQTIESDANGCGVFCTSDGELVYTTCRRAPTTTQITTTTPTTPPKRLGCEYQGKFYPVGARFGEGKDGSWCYGSICGEGGQVLAWDNFNCDSTTRPQTTTPTPPTPRGCSYNGKNYLPGEEISRATGPNICYGTLCDDNGDVIAWEDYTCGNSTADDTLTQEPVKDCQYKGVFYKPGQKIALTDGRGCKVYCSLVGRVRIERFPCVQPVTQPQTDTDIPGTAWPPCIPKQFSGPDTPPGRICVNGGSETTMHPTLNLIALTIVSLFLFWTM